jgi:signal transduction histidine kinase
MIFSNLHPNQSLRAEGCLVQMVPVLYPVLPNPIGKSDFSSDEESIILVPDILYGNDSLRRAKILIIDGELPNVQFLGRILRRVRIVNFVSTTDSRAALSLFQEFRPDLVVIDWLMADVNGRRVVEQLRALIPIGGFVPIVVLTADATSDARQLVLASGANEVITKPIDACEVVLRIANMIQVRLAHLRLYEQKQALEETVRRRTVELEQARGKLGASEQLLAQTQHLSAIGTMASGIAHDFNNALMLIMGFCEILLADAESRRLTNESAVPLLKDIFTAARDASTLVGQLREFSKSGGTGEVHEPVNLNVVIEQAVSLTRPKWDAQAFADGSQIRMKIDSQDLPVILGDAARLREAVTNLIFNAVDAMPGGGILTLRTRAEGEAVRLEVSDTGLGMSEEVRRNCLEPFFTTKGQQGTGLGLAMVFDTVVHHQGTIDIGSNPGQGTTFTLRLPGCATAL